MTAASIIQRSALPPGTLVVAAVSLAVGGFGPNSPIALLAIAVLMAGAFLLWRPGESPIFLFVFGYQWLQASLKIFKAGWLGVDVGQLPSYGGDIEQATVLSLLGLLALGVGLRVGAGPWRFQDGMLARFTTQRLTIQSWFRLYIVAFAIATLAQSIARVVPGLSQPLLALANLKWAFFWMLAYATFARARSDKLYLLLALGLEIALGIGAYFSDFKTPFFFTFMAAVTARLRVSVGRYLVLAVLGTVVLAMAMTWTAVKVDYRHYLNGGADAQVVTVGYVERVEKLTSMIGELDAATLSKSFGKLLDRLAYVDFFAVVLDTVPGAVPHEDGALWWDAISRPFMPRLLFPEKTAIDDSVRTNYYTGLDLPTSEEGTSISLGYMAESYIDFGKIGMMVPIFGLGLLLGRYYRFMLNHDPSRLLGMALATATIFEVSFLESSITKVFGGLVISMLASWAVLRIAPKHIPWLRSGRALA